MDKNKIHYACVINSIGIMMSIEKLIKIISAFCPETLDHSKRNPIDQLPSIKRGKEDVTPHLDNRRLILI